MKKNALGLAACAVFVVLTAVAIGLLRWPLVSVLLGLGAAAVAAAWWRLKP
jgi:chromate transporter